MLIFWHHCCCSTLFWTTTTTCYVPLHNWHTVVSRLFVHFLLSSVCVLRSGPSLCAEGLLQDPGQHGASSWDRGAAFHRLLWMPRSEKHEASDTQVPVHLLCVFTCVNLCVSLRSVFRRAPRVHAGPDDRRDQELLPEVPASQSDLSHTLETLSRVHSLPLGAGSWLSDWNGLWVLTFCPSSPGGLELLWWRKNNWSCLDIWCVWKAHN